MICFPCSSFQCSHSRLLLFFFSFQQINVGSRCNSRALASFQSLSEVSALVFMFRLTFESHEWAANCESLLSEESGAEAPAKSALIFDLSFPGSLTLLALKSERETLRTRLNVLPLTCVFLKLGPVYRLGKRIPYFIQISFWEIIFSTLTTLLMGFALNHQF